MNLAIPTEGLENYKSLSQRARISSESWAAQNLYCPRCASDRIDTLPGNTPVIDFQCPNCNAGYQLKSASHAFRNKLTDGANSQMHSAILRGKTPNLFLLHYEQNPLSVAQLIFIPDFAFTLSALECRKPLAATARRAGWIGCNILLTQIPEDARIGVVKEKRPVSPGVVRTAFQKLKPLSTLKPETRGWTLDVLNAIRSLGQSEFNLHEIYALETTLRKFHPNNHHIQPKIRQQLQILRDLGLIEFLGAGLYRM